MKELLTSLDCPLGYCLVGFAAALCGMIVWRISKFRWTREKSEISVEFGDDKESPRK